MFCILAVCVYCICVLPLSGVIQNNYNNCALMKAALTGYVSAALKLISQTHEHTYTAYTDYSAMITNNCNHNSLVYNAYISNWRG